jgi:hypothetical protein
MHGGILQNGHIASLHGNKAPARAANKLLTINVLNEPCRGRKAFN